MYCILKILNNNALLAKVKEDDSERIDVYKRQVLTDTAKEVWDACEMMIKVKEPLEEEYKYFHKDLILYTYLHLSLIHI